MSAFRYPHNASLEILRGRSWPAYAQILTFRSFVSGERKYWYLQNEVASWCSAHLTGSYEIPSVCIHDDLRRPAGAYGFQYASISFEHEDDMIAFILKWF